MSQVDLPAADAVASAAKRILDSIKDDPQFAEFRAASLEYSDDWQCFTGFPVVAQWNLEADAAPLFEEGLRALALKAAVFEATRDDEAAEVAIAVPVDEMTHAMLAQSQLLARIAARTGAVIIHQTDQEHTDYRANGYTHNCYRLAWGEPCGPVLAGPRGGEPASRCARRPVREHRHGALRPGAQPRLHAAPRPS